MRHWTVISVLAALLAVGCADRRVELLRPVDLPAVDPPQELTYEPLAEALRELITPEGLVDPFYLGEMVPVLERQLARLAEVGPISTPDRFADPNEILAYWYNARAGWSLRLLAMRNPGGWVELDDPNDRLDSAEDLYRKPFRLDGKMMTLGEIDDYLSCFEDFRVLVASPGVTFQRAPMPRQPFDPNSVAAAVAQRFQDFIDDPERLVIDRLNRVVRVPPVLWQFRDRLVRHYMQTYDATDVDLLLALLEHTSGSPRRRLQNAMGYTPVRARPSYEPAVTPLDRPRRYKR